MILGEGNEELGEVWGLFMFDTLASLAVKYLANRCARRVGVLAFFALWRRVEVGILHVATM